MKNASGRGTVTNSKYSGNERSKSASNQVIRKKNTISEMQTGSKSTRKLNSNKEYQQDPPRKTVTTGSKAPSNNTPLSKTANKITVQNYDDKAKPRPNTGNGAHISQVKIIRSDVNENIINSNNFVTPGGIWSPTIQQSGNSPRSSGGPSKGMSPRGEGMNAAKSNGSMSNIKDPGQGSQLLTPNYEPSLLLRKESLNKNKKLQSPGGNNGLSVMNESLTETERNKLATEQNKMANPEMVKPIIKAENNKKGEKVDSNTEKKSETKDVKSKVKGESNMEKLSGLKGMIIKQKLSAAEALKCMEAENIYRIFTSDGGGNKGREILIGKEVSNCITRQIMPGSCRPFEMTINFANGGPFISLSRSCRLTFLCCNRPSVEVYAQEKNQMQYLGSVFNPCSIFFQVDIYDRRDEYIYSIRGNCLQCGVLLPLPCGECQKVFFSIVDSYGSQVGSVTKILGRLQYLFKSDNDSFSINFPKRCSNEDKVLILSACLFLDYCYFESNANSE